MKTHYYDFPPYFHNYSLFCGSDLNLIDWSSNNVLAVALNENLYLFNTETGDIQLLFTLEGTEDYISSLRWVDDGRHIAVGTSNAEVQVNLNKLEADLTDHIIILINNIINKILMFKH